jgi:hypothetical protein
MKKLRFEEVLRYLESGEDDPRFELFLKDDPNGQKMLEEARRLHELIREQAEEDGSIEGPEISALKMSVADAAPEMFDMDASAEPVGASGNLFEEELPELPSKDLMVAATLARRASGKVRNLGDLTIVGRQEDVLLSFEPASPQFRPSIKDDLSAKKKGGPRTFYQSARSARMRESDSEFMAFMSGRTSTGALKIRGTGIEILLPVTQEQYEPIRLQVTDIRLRTPVRGLELVFMPEHGPFIKLVTDSKGVAELKLPEQPGVLRLETRVPQRLNIRLSF